MTRYTFVCLKNTEVRPEYTDSLSSRLLISTEIGPTWRQAIENRDGSSARPKVPLTPPVRVWLIWQATPGTFGASHALTQPPSFLTTNRQVVQTQRTTAARGAGVPRLTATARP